jgi:hypothetical protein
MPITEKPMAISHDILAHFEPIFAEPFHAAATELRYIFAKSCRYTHDILHRRMAARD